MGTASAVFETTTNAIIEAIENGTSQWQMPWSTIGVEFPINPTTDKHYRGGNVLTLLATAHDHGYGSGEWATYKQWDSIGAQVRKGEHGTACVWWNINNPSVTVNDDKQPDGTVELSGRPRFMARTFIVFNAAQVDGHTPAIVERDSIEQIDIAEQFFATVGAHVEHRNEGRAYYSPTHDLIVLLPRNTFTDAPAYYATSAHEHGHWTGHTDRLNRDLTGRYNENAYAVEELVAELSAAFTCAILGISPTPRPDHAQYLAHWLNVLRTDPKALHAIAGKAQAATDHLTALTEPRISVTAA
jgi:antirestriction protein ArdC